MSLQALCTHPQLKDVVFDILDVRDAMPLRLVSNTIRAAVEDFGLQVFAEKIADDNQSAAEQHKELLGVTDHLELDQFGDHSSSRGRLFSSNHETWSRLLAVVAKTSNWVVEDGVLAVVRRAHCLYDSSYGRGEAELMYRCRGRGALYACSGFQHLPVGAEGKTILREMLAEVKRLALSRDDDFGPEMGNFALSCVPALEVADLSYFPVSESGLEGLTSVAKGSLKVLTIGDPRQDAVSPSASAFVKLLEECVHLHTISFTASVPQEVINCLARIASRLLSLSIKLDYPSSIDLSSLAAACTNLRQIGASSIDRLGSFIIDRFELVSSCVHEPSPTACIDATLRVPTTPNPAETAFDERGRPGLQRGR